MPGRIALQLDSTPVSLVPGGERRVGISVTNLGSVVDEFVLTVAGLYAEWYTLEPERVSLFPQAEAQFSCAFTLPRSHRSSRAIMHSP